jgi:adenylate cyclase, class 2
MGRIPPMEVEAKYRVADVQLLEKKLENLGAQFLSQEKHRDTYLRHPCRDFRTTEEALRLRWVNGKPWITYKGPRQPGPVKVRPETELELGNADDASWLAFWQALGFEPVASVVKLRRTFQLQTDRRPLEVALDAVEGIGNFVEIERICDSDDEVELSKSDIATIAYQLGLNDDESKSYLALVVESFNQ